MFPAKCYCWNIIVYIALILNSKNVNTIDQTQEILNLIKNDDLKQVLSYLINQCNGELKGHIESDEDDYSDITIYSEFFDKKKLEVIFKYCRYPEIIFSPKFNKMKIGMELYLSKSSI